MPTQQQYEQPELGGYVAPPNAGPDFEAILALAIALLQKKADSAKRLGASKKYRDSTVAAYRALLAKVVRALALWEEDLATCDTITLALAIEVGDAAHVAGLMTLNAIKVFPHPVTIELGKQQLDDLVTAATAKLAVTDESVRFLRPVAALATKQRYAFLMSAVFEAMQSAAADSVNHRADNPALGLPEDWREADLMPTHATYYTRSQTKLFLHSLLQPDAEPPREASGKLRLARDRAICIFMLATGVRASELVAIRLKDINDHEAEEGVPNFTVTVDRSAPTAQKTRTVMVDAWARPHLAHWIRELKLALTRTEVQVGDVPLFPGVREQREKQSKRLLRERFAPITPGTVYEVYERACSLAKHRQVAEQSAPLDKGPTTLRNTFIARALWSAQWTPEALAKQVGIDFVPRLAKLTYMRYEIDERVVFDPKQP